MPSPLEMLTGLPVAAAKAEPAFDFQILPGVTSEIAQQFVGAGYKGPDDVLANADALQGFRGIGPAKAETILAAARGLLKPPTVDEDRIEKEMAALLG